MRILSRLSPRMRKIFDWVAGLTLIAVGIVGFALPVLQGWVFVIMGLAVLSSHNRHAKAIYDRLKSVGRSVRDKVTHRRDRSRERRESSDPAQPHAPPLKSPVSDAPDPGD